MVDVRLPDGTIVRNVPEGITQSELMRRVRKLDEPSVGAADAFVRGAANTILDTVLNTPNVAVRLASEAGLTPQRGRAGPLEAVAEAIRVTTGGRIDPLEAAETFAQTRGRAIDTPRAADVIASLETASQVPGAVVRGEPLDLGQRFQQARTREQVTDLQASAEQPLATVLGEMGATGALLAGGRAGLGLRAQPGLKVPAAVQPRFTDLTTKMIKGLQKAGVNLARGGKKAAEVGLEGAVVALFQEGDPVATASYGAGAQAAGSLSLFMLEKPFRRLLPTVATATVASQIFQAVAPGDRNVFDAFDFAIDKVILAFGLGITSGLAGSGRLRGLAAERAPILADAITAVPRGALLNRLSEFTSEAERGEDLLFRITRKIETDPDFFSPGEMDQLGRALTSKKKDALGRTVAKLSKNRKFREKLEALDPPSQPPRRQAPRAPRPTVSQRPR